MVTQRGLSSAIILPIFLIFLIIPLSSAAIKINQQPDPVYNLGDVIPISSTATSTTAVTGIFQMNLLCSSGNETNFYKIPVSLSPGEPKTIQSSLILSRTIIGELKGTCRVNAFLGTDSVFTNDFQISDLINIESNISKTDFNPGESILVTGNAVKENGKPANGFIELNVLDGNSTVLSRQGTANNGLFSANITLLKDMKAGDYLIRIKAYEQLSGVETNNGSIDKNIYIKQVPTNLEIVFEQPGADIEPGTSVKVKAVLHDQTGVKIDSLTFLTVKNSKDKILNQVEKPTDEFLEFPIAYNEAPSSWKVVAVSNKLTSESVFRILEKENATVEIINKTVLITNTGNVPYNKTILVKIGNQPFNIDVYLKIDQSQRWLLTAPDGEYPVEVINEGQITGASVALTGTSIDVKKASANIGSLVRFPAVWIFVLAVLGFVAFIFFKRGYQKTFIGYISSKLPKKSQDKSIGMNISVHNPKSSRAELALSIKGDKQDVSMITLKAKNMSAIKNQKDSKSGVGEILKKVKDIAESHKAAVYEDHDSLFFIFAPVRTKTFKNEEAALKVSQKIKEILYEYNRLFKQKIDFGMSLNYGTMIAKQEPDSFKFMGLGTFMTQSKKIASVADNDILMGERITDRLRSIVKTEKHRKENIDVYAIKEIKKYEEHQKFLKGFVKRMEKG